MPSSEYYEKGAKKADVDAMKDIMRSVARFIAFGAGKTTQLPRVGVERFFQR